MLRDINNLERRCSKGKVTVGYIHDPSRMSMVAYVRDLQIGQEKISLIYRQKYHYHFPEPNELQRSIEIEFKGIHWSIGHGRDYWITTVSEGGKELSMTDDWAIAHDEDIKPSPGRRAKAKQIFDALYKRIEAIPPIKRYMDGFDSYLLEKKAENDRVHTENNQKYLTRKRRLKAKFAKVPDPLDPLVQLVTSVKD